MRQARHVHLILMPVALAGLLFGCSAGVMLAPPGPDGGSPEDHPAPVDRVTQDRMATVTDTSTTPDDGGCANQSSGAQAVPIDLYVMMDSSKSMLDTTNSGVVKWKAIQDAMTAFFTDNQSKGIGVALKYFPDVQNAPETCTVDGDCGSFGPCDFRRSCVTKNTMTNSVTTQSLCTDNTGCATTESCAKIANCGGNTYCVSDGPACPTSCTLYAGYCHLRDICDAADYATPVVPIGILDGTATGPAAALNSSLMTHTPTGFTPTGPALEGAYQYAHSLATANPDHKQAVILVTDGIPGGFTPANACAPSDVPTIAGQEMTAATGTPPIPTFVIGLFGPSDPSDAASNLNMLAAGGGTGNAVIIDTTMSIVPALQAALNQIRTTEIACSYTIPKSKGGVLDFNTVVVTFNDGAGNITTLPYLKSVTSCATKPNGWYFDNDPNVSGGPAPTSIILCASGCSQYQGNAAGTLSTAIGCVVQVPG